MKPCFAGCAVLAVFLSILPLPLPAQPTMQDIRAGLRDPSPLRRYEAIESLGEMSTPEAIRALIELTADDDNSWLAVRQLVLLKDRAVPFLLESLQSQDPKIVKFAIYALGDLKAKQAAEKIRSYLTHPDCEIRQNAVFALGYMRDGGSVDALILKLGDPDNVVREYAAAALEYIGDPKAVPYLRQALLREEGSVFNMATALYNMGGEDVIDILLDKLRDPKSSNRLYAVYALGKIRDEREVVPLIDCLTDENVQWLAVKALINLGDLAEPALLNALSDRRKEVRLYAIYALGEMGNAKNAKSLVDFLIDPDQLLREYTCDALIKLNNRDITSRLLYYLEKGDCTIQGQVLRVLGAISDRSVADRIYYLLWCDNAQVKMNAAAALGEIRDVNATASLIKLMNDPSPGVSTTAAAALVKIGKPAVPALLAALPTASGRVETGVIYVLGRLRSREAVDQILRKVASEDVIVRRYATVALTEIADPRAEEHLVMLLTDPDPHVRTYASVGLMEFGGRLSVKLLLNALRSEETRWLAVRILDKIGPRGVDEIIAALKDQRIQWYASETLIRLDGAILPALEEGLKSDEEAIRNNIAIILGEVRDKRAVSALLEAMKDESKSVSLAASSLVSIGDLSAVEPLIECLTHPNEQVRLYAAYVLGHLKDTRAVEPLLLCLKDKEPGIRGIAAYSLGLIGSRKATFALVGVLNDPDENVRLSTVYSLGKLGDPQGLPFIRERGQKDSSQKVRRAAREVLEQVAYSSSP